MKNKKGLVFIAGNGRSGTTWLGNTIGASENASLISEKHHIFYKSRALAINYTLAKELTPTILRYYNLKISEEGNFHYYIDKSHVNIWFVEDLLYSLPSSKSIIIYRNPLDCVSSMLKHKKVIEPVREWAKYPFPNKFLGLGTICDLDTYQKYDIVQRAAVRWVSHYLRAKSLESLNSSRLLTIKYEEFESSLNGAKINSFIGDDVDFSSFNPSSIGRFREGLTYHQQLKVVNVVKKYAPDYSFHFDINS